jgi:16S rRNA processing protein RimM
MHEGYIRLGFVKRAHGVNGQVLAWIDLPGNVLDDLKTIFVEEGRTLVPYQVSHLQLSDSQAILSFQGVGNRTQAYELKGKVMFIRQIDIPEQVLQAEPELTLVGYQAFDKQRGALGKVVRTQELPGQTMLVINYLNKELMIPMHKDLIEGVDHVSKQINVQLPPGFIEAVI